MGGHGLYRAVTLAIVEAVAGDRHAVVALWRDCGLTRPWNDPDADFDRAIGTHDATVLLCRDEGGIAATVMVGWDGHRGWVYYLCVAPAERRCGLGRALMTAAEEWLRARVSQNPADDPRGQCRCAALLRSTGTGAPAGGDDGTISGRRRDVSVTLYGIPNCDTVKKARVWLGDNAIEYRFHDYKKAGIDAAHLERWADVLGWEMLLNRAGTTFRKLDDDAKADLDQAKAIRLMIDQPSMIKRPVVEHPGGLLLGFKPELWARALL